MVPEMRQFLLEFAELLDKHKVDCEAVDDGASYNASVDGVEFYIAASGTFKDYMVKLPQTFDASSVTNLLTNFN